MIANSGITYSRRNGRNVPFFEFGTQSAPAAVSTWFHAKLKGRRSDCLVGLLRPFSFFYVGRLFSTLIGVADAQRVTNP
jgi:hypothetical protein